MRASVLLAFGLALSASVFACGATDEPTDDPSANVDEGSEQDLTSARKQVNGDWKNDDGSLDAFDFRADGTFIHDQFRILNGVMIQGGSKTPIGRDSGRYVMSTAHNTITLHITAGWHAGSSEVYAYTYTPARILNGVLINGAEPPGAKLNLTLQPAPRSHVAYPTKHYKHVSSFCAAVGASCVGLAPTSCKGGTVLDATNFSCGGGLGVECCQK